MIELMAQVCGSPGDRIVLPQGMGRVLMDELVRKWGWEVSNSWQKKLYIQDINTWCVSGTGGSTGWNSRTVHGREYSAHKSRKTKLKLPRPYLCAKLRSLGFFS